MRVIQNTRKWLYWNCAPKSIHLWKEDIHLWKEDCEQEHCTRWQRKSSSTLSDLLLLICSLWLCRSLYVTKVRYVINKYRYVFGRAKFISNRLAKTLVISLSSTACCCYSCAGNRRAFLSLLCLCRGFWHGQHSWYSLEGWNTIFVCLLNTCMWWLHPVTTHLKQQWTIDYQSFFFKQVHV